MLGLLLGGMLAGQGIVVGDYLPGPWVVFVSADGRVLPEASAAIARVREMFEVLPGRTVNLCPDGAAVSARVERRNVRAVERALVRAGVSRRRMTAGRGCGAPVRDRPAGVMITPA